MKKVLNVSKGMLKKIDIPVPRVSKHGRERLARILLTGLMVLSLGFLGGWLGAESRSDSSNTAQQQPILNESQLISRIAREVGPSVVSVNVISQGTSASPFSFGRSFEQESAGTGVIISESGYVITNRHVIPASASDVTLTLEDGTELTDVTVVGRTSENDPLDIAFLKIEDRKGKTLTPAKLGDSSKVEVGDRVVAIGNALGQFQNTVTTGIISGYARDVQAVGEAGATETLQNLFQTDASINQGNSGGPLLNINGEVIGINTAVAGGRAENIGFAIPINDVQGLVRSVLDQGKLERPYLGVRYVSITDSFAFEENLPVNRGAYVLPGEEGRSSVIPNSPADKAGLRERDIITEIDGTKIDEDHSLISLLSRKNVGDEVALKVLRDGNELTITVTLEANPQN